MSTPDNTDPDALLTRRDIILHQQSLDFAKQELAKLTPEQCRAIAHNVLYFAAFSRLNLCSPEGPTNDYVCGYLRAIDAILNCSGIDIKLTAHTKLN